MKKAAKMFRPAAVLILFLALMMSAAVTPVCAATAGGWKVSKARYSFLTSSQKKIFNKAIKMQAGLMYTPVAQLAKKTVAGTNYVFLCQGETATAKPVKKWYILTASKNLKNKVTIRSLKKLKISNIKTSEYPRDEVMDGGLQITAVKKKSAALSKSVKKIFDKGIQKYVGYEFRPVALLGTQTVAGKNYRFLCYGTGHPGTDYFVVDITKDLDGVCNVTYCEPLNLEKYTD